MINGSHQPRHGIAKAKHLGLAKYYAQLSEQFFSLATETQQEEYLNLALQYEQTSKEHKALAQ